ncbi:MAG: hypothetical protein ACXV7G_11145 [Halobacteriota archaeon]
MKTRPKGISIVAVISFLAALVAVLVAVSILFLGTPLDVIWSLKNSFPAGFKNTSVGMLFGYLLLVLAVVGFCSVYGLVKGLKWAWWIVIVTLAVNGIGDAVSVAQGNIAGIAGILIAAVFLFYLTRPNVRAFFENRSSRTME